MSDKLLQIFPTYNFPRIVQGYPTHPAHMATFTATQGCGILVPPCHPTSQLDPPQFQECLDRQCLIS